MTRASNRNKLGEWMRYAPIFAQEEVAEKCNSSLGYLRMLGYGHRVNPKVKLALAIVDATTFVREKYGLKYLPEITIRDLAEMKEYKKEV